MAADVDGGHPSSRFAPKVIDAASGWEAKFDLGLR